MNIMLNTTQLVAEQLCESAGLQAGWRVLDVGSGNAALAAARRGCTAVGIDSDVESLSFPDVSFDAVMSVFGCMLAADHARAAAELLRVCKPGGTIALASWTPEGYAGELVRPLGPVTAPAGVPSPLLWGTEEHLRHLWGDSIASLEVAERTLTLPPAWSREGDAVAATYLEAVALTR